jgi:hypothetical protein
VYLTGRGVHTHSQAIGGQRIEEFMNNKSYTGAIACPDAVGAQEIRTPWNGQLFAKQVQLLLYLAVTV